MKLANLGPLSENYFSNYPLDEQEVEAEEEELSLDDLGGEEDIAMDAEEELEEPALGGGDENEELLARVVQAVADELGVEVDVEGAAEEGGEDELEVGAELEEPLPGGGEEELELGAEEEIPGNMEAYQENQELNEMGDPASMALLMKALVPILGPVSAKALAAVLTAGGLAAATAASHPGRSVSLPDEGEGEVAVGAEEEVVAEVARRVAERLMADKKKDAVADQLAERIFARLTEK